MGKTTLAPGFRFSPTDVELVKYYLKRKVMGKKLHFEGIAEVDIYKFAPWDLPDKSYLRSGDLKWYFYCPREKKYASGTRLNRATDFGYWKTTGKDRPVHYNNEVTGMIKTLVFHQGKAPHGDRTNWVMHEYRLQDKDLVTRQVVQDAYVLCVIFKKDGLGPRNGAQYGAPFREEDWSDDEEEVNCTEAVSSAGLLAPVLAIPPNQMDTGASSSRVPVPEHQRVGSSSNSCASDIVPSAYNVIQTPDIGRSDPMPMEVSQVPDHDILSMLAVFTDYDTPALNDNGQNQERPAHLNHAGNVAAPNPLNGNDIYNELADLGTLGKLNDGAYNLSNAYAMTMVTPADHAFLELLDLDPPLNCTVQDPSLNCTVQDPSLNCTVQDPSLHCTVQDPSLDSTVKDPPSSSTGLQYLLDNVPPHPVLGSGHLSPFNGYGNYRSGS